MKQEELTNGSAHATKLRRIEWEVSELGLGVIKKSLWQYDCTGGKEKKPSPGSSDGFLNSIIELSRTNITKQAEEDQHVGGSCCAVFVEVTEAWSAIAAKISQEQQQVSYIHYATVVEVAFTSGARGVFAVAIVASCG